MNGTTAKYFGIAGVAAGVLAIVVAVYGDMRVEVTFGIAVVAVALFVILIGALVAEYRPITAGIVMLAGVIAIVVGQWGDISLWTQDLWTTATGGTVTHAWKETVYTQSFVNVLLGSVAMLGYAASVILGTIGGAVALFTPEREAAFRPAPRPAAI